MNFKEIMEMAEFENRVRYSHLDERLMDIDDELKQLEIDRICCELDIDIAETLGDDDEAQTLYEELAEIMDEIEDKLVEYDTVLDFFDKELIEILSIAEITERNKNSIFND
ncbi:hypothetical protein AAK964_12290 [Tissierella praeacuta]|uniref:hypothetical protein n=1 Tax=Tissierella praeacuta TaxID=43131 RepID=UPI003517F404